ncbi:MULTISPECIES: CaiB/BaiF CoA transferase family protein [Streptomyces]|uniref:CaiB/BaiF CoA transferase family protein n=1 Tax=Streptomyces TaxID=1883 RepID=UPI0003A5D1DE|nr:MULTISPECIES: CoA transferase [Streptomyces]MBE8477399.1 CoA transferase [Streptomyces justiciae]
MSDGRSLSGLKVVELGHLIAGPVCGRMFADHGADVIKVEPPNGDPMRHWGRLYNGVGLHWSYVGRGKSSVVINLATAEGQEQLKRLLGDADVVIENFRPGTLEKWGLGWDVLHELNPALILIRISGFGQTGPYKHRPGFGLIGEAMSGFRYMTAEPGRPPVRVGISIADTMAGIYGFVGAQLALRVRDRTGAGQMVDVALYEAMWSLMESIAAEYELMGVVREPQGSILPGIAPSNVYQTSDGVWLAIGANQDAVFERFARAAGHEEWLLPDSYATHNERALRQTELDQEVAEWARSLDSQKALLLLDEAGVPASRIYNAADIHSDEHFRARDMILRVADPSLDSEEVPMPGIVPKLSATPGAVERGAPRLGEHNHLLD